MNKDLNQGTSAAVQSFLLPYLSVLPTINEFLTTHPYWQLSWYGAIGLYGVYLQYNQDEVNDLVNFINEHPEEFVQEIVETESFRKGFLRILEAYLKSRDEEKRQIIKRLFLGFSKKTDQQNFALEKLLSIQEQLDVEDINIMKIYVDGSLQKWIESQSIHEPERVQEQVMDECYNVHQIGDLILNKMNGLNQFSSAEYTREKLDYLKSIGLLTQDIHFGGIGSGGGDNIDYRPSEIGKEFLKYITG